ncbi:unnamed protein product [Closterium sp. NIES-53]
MVPSELVLIRNTHFPERMGLSCASDAGTIFQSLLDRARLLKWRRSPVHSSDEAQDLESAGCVTVQQGILGIDCFVSRFRIRCESGAIAFRDVGVDGLGCYVTSVGEMVVGIGIDAVARVFVVHGDWNGTVGKGSSSFGGAVDVFFFPVGSVGG